MDREIPYELIYVGGGGFSMLGRWERLLDVGITEVVDLCISMCVI